MSLEDLIKERIRSQGAIPVADYMAMALTHPQYGYYMRKDPFGTAGDFITAPEISQVFGEVLGAWLAEQWQQMGKPEVALVEPGPGRGTLMADMLRATRHVAGFHDAVSVHLVEVSESLKQKQWQQLSKLHSNLQWHASIDELPEKPLLLVANEFFDALPIRQFVHNDTGWQERMVGMGANGNLEFVTKAQLPPPSLKDNPVADDIVYEYCDAAITITDTLARHIAHLGGAALIIDYGYSGRTRGDTLQTVREHQYHDVLVDPGTADLTAHVDFDALKQAAEAAGAATYGVVPQGVLLNHLGAGIRTQKLCENATAPQKSAMISAFERLTSVDKMGDLFKALCIAHPKHPRPEGF